MTEIKAGNSFNASTRLMQEMHKAAEDGVVEAKELARLAQIALDDSSGLTEDEQKMLSSLYSGKIDTTGLTEQEKNAITQLQKGSSGVSAEVVDKNIKALQSLKSHTNDPTQLDFSSLQLVSESKSFLSRASFGLFGGTTQTSHVVRISDGNIPTVNNPQQTTTMAERSLVERENLVNMLSPLNQELQEGLADPNSDIRQRFAEFIGQPADSKAVTDSMNALSNRINNFQSDPTKGDWSNSSDLTALMNSYAKNPPQNNERLNAGYMHSLLGSFWNASDASYFAETQRQSFDQGNIQTPTTVAEVNEQLSQTNAVASKDMQQMLTKTSDFINQLDSLKESDPELYQKVLRGMDESGLDFLRAQVSDLKQHQQNGGVITQAQVNQINNMAASLNELRKTLDLGPTPDDRQSLEALNQILNDPATPEEAKPELQKEIERLSQQQTPPVPVEQQARLDALRTARSEASSAVYTSLSSSEDAAQQRSNTIFELEQAQNTLTDLLSQHGISEAGRAKLQSQLTATQGALQQLRNNQPVQLEGEAQANLEQVLTNLQKLRPQPQITSANSSIVDQSLGMSSIGDPSYEMPDLELPLYETSSIGFSTGINTSLLFNSRNNTGLGSNLFSLNAITTPYSSPSFPGYFNDDPLGFGFGSSSSFGGFGLNDYGMCSPSLGFGGLYGGLGGFDYGLPPLSLPSIAPPSNSGTTNTPPPSLSNIFLENLGEDPSNVTRIDPALNERRASALETVNAILSDNDASQEAKAAAQYMQQVLNDENNINMTLPSGSLEASIGVLESYQQLKDMGISTANAEVVFMFAAQGIREQASPAAIAEHIKGITQTGTTEEITERLKQTRIENFVQKQTNLSESANELINSDVFKRTAQKLLGKSENLTDQDITQILNHQQFKTEFDVIKGTLQTDLANLNQEAASLVDQVRSSNLSRAQSVRNIDDAIQALSNEPRLTADQARLLEQLQSVKTRSEALRPQIAGIDQLSEVNRNYTTVLNEMNQAISALRSVPGTEAAADLEALTAFRDSFQRKGFLEPTEAAEYGRLRVNQRMHNFEAAVASDPGATSTDHQNYREAFGAFHQAETPEQMDTAFSNILTGMSDGTLRVPRGTLFQNRVLQTFGLPPTDRNLSPEDFIALLRTRPPSTQIEEDGGEQADMMTGRLIASNTLTGQPPLEQIPEIRAGFMAQVMSTATGPEGLASRASTSPTAAAVLNSSRVAQENREAAYNSDDPAAAFAGLLETRTASQAIFDAMDQNISQSVNELRLANDNVMIANGFPPLGSASEPGRITGAQAGVSPRTQALINDANALGDSLILAPVPSSGGEEFLNNLINDFIDIIRDLDYKTRQLVLQQLAQQMTNNAITQFYKDKVDEGNQYHQQALDRLAENFKEQIERTIESGLASQAGSSQGVAAVSGQVNGAALATAIDSVSARESIAQMLDITSQMNPPLSQQQQERILGAVTRIMEAGGLPPLTDAQLGLPGLSNPLLRDQVVS